jgi:hypothetical protein
VACRTLFKLHVRNDCKVHWLILSLLNCCDAVYLCCQRHLFLWREVRYINRKVAVMNWEIIVAEFNEMPAEGQTVYFFIKTGIKIAYKI